MGAAMTIDDALRAVAVMDAVFLPIVPQRRHDAAEARALHDRWMELAQQVGRSQGARMARAEYLLRVFCGVDRVKPGPRTGRTKRAD